MKNFWKPLKWLIPELEMVRGLILLGIEQARLPGEDLNITAKNLFDPPGKMIRPGMLLLSARLMGDEEMRASKHRVPDSLTAEGFVRKIRSEYRSLADLRNADLNAAPAPGALPLRFYLMAAAIEMLHSATLLHDDVLDNADVRRNLPSVPRRLGNHRAILLGDQLLTMAFEMIGDAASLNSARLISRVVSGICRGELLQNSLLFDPESGSSMRRYRERIAGKTAAMFSLALYLGAREMEHHRSESMHPDQLRPEDHDDPRSDSSACRRIRRYGYNIGMAFQIIDDVLDLDVSSDSGKEKGKDIREGIITLPIIRMLRAGTLTKPRLRELWAEPGEIPGFLETAEMTMACVESMGEARIYMERADRELQAASDESGTDLSDLSAVSAQLLRRRR
jgi:geranylgeranyl pyrophosphate synthase